ncbi:MAG: DUF2863 family protein [Formivibrio sp.]|nr:DUF2863 family protein [Formivibrio sp.]
MSLPDPRNYAPVNARNPLIRQLMSLMTEHDPQAIITKRAGLHAQITELLAANDHAALNAALSQAPAMEAWLTLWQALREVLETTPADADKYASLFAIPVVIVAGSDKGATLPGKLIAPEDILNLLRQHDVLAPTAVAYLAPELVSIETLSAISPSQQIRWKTDKADLLSNGSSNLFDLTPAPLAIKEEAAALRFIVGAVLQPGNTAPLIQLGGSVSPWGMALAQTLGTQLATEGATVLALPRAPQSWLSAQENGRLVLLETRLQLLASNAIRTIRSKGRTPVAIIAAHESDEIRITFSSREDAERWQGFVWPLAPGERVEQIVDFAQTLFHDCQVQDIRLVDTIQPDCVNELPFFVTAHFAPMVHH